MSRYLVAAVGITGCLLLTWASGPFHLHDSSHMTLLAVWLVVVILAMTQSKGPKNGAV